MRKGYWKRYYKRNKSKLREKCNKWRQDNPERARELSVTYRNKNIDKDREQARERYKKWVSVEENHNHKKAYQKEWYIKFRKEDKESMKSLMQELKHNRAKINGYDIELKQDKGGMWFYYMAQSNNVVYISDKFEKRIDAIRDLEYAL